MKEFRCFIENASLASPDTTHVPLVYELSEEGRTYAKKRERIPIKGDDRNLVQSFHVDKNNMMNEAEAKIIVSVANSFVAFLETQKIENRPNIIKNFTSYYNNLYPNNTITDFSYNRLIVVDGTKYPDYFSFQTSKMKCSVWLSDQTFKLFYPRYDIDVVTPFEEFDKVVKVPSEMLVSLGKFDINKFSRRCDEIKDGIPSTFTRMINIPYRPRKDLKSVDCWFGFNIYGAAGDYEHLMREELYNYLKDKLKVDDAWIEEHFPTIFEVNEFFMIPQWTTYAIPNKTGQGSINSQVSKVWTEAYNMGKFVKAYDVKDKDTFMKANTYNVPFTYNNILCRVLNGYYTEKEVKDFRDYYGDLLTVSSTNPDFARMSTRTQLFSKLSEHMFSVSDAMNETELFNKLMSNTYMLEDKPIKFAIAVRRGLTYISLYYDMHRYFIMPRYEYIRVEALK